MLGQSRERTRRVGSEDVREFGVRLGGIGHMRVCIAVLGRDGGCEKDGGGLTEEGDDVIRLTSSDLGEVKMEIKEEREEKMYLGIRCPSVGVDTPKVARAVP